MFSSYIKLALRNMVKNRIYAAINIIGLSLGIMVYLFGGIVADYEQNHDTMFENHERIYTVGSKLSPNASIGVQELDSTFTAMAPHIKDGLPEAEHVVRTVRRSYLLSVGEDNFFQEIKFADAGLTRVFDFNYIVGDASALDDPKGIILTETVAMKIFGSTDILGETVMFDHEHDMRVQAVIEDVPQNSHFNSSILTNEQLGVISSLVALNRIADWDLAGNWNNMSLGNHIYVMTKEVVDIDELENKINAIFETHADEELRQDFITRLHIRHLKEASSAIWDMVGMPVIASVQILGVLVLIIAIVNYSNLATAQSMGRTREVGMRKTLGASRGQLLAQFLTESVTIVLFATIVSLVLLEFIVPVFNEAMNKVVSLNYLSLIPWLVTTVVVVGLIAGAYPSYLITKVNPTQALKNETSKGAKGGFLRSLMIGTQFTLSIFMLAVVMIVYFQNEKVKEASDIFPKDEVLLFTGMSKEKIREREDLLRNELIKHPDISLVTFATQVPFEQSDSRIGVQTELGNEDTTVDINVIQADYDYFKMFDIPFVAGRTFSRDVASDKNLSEDATQFNVVISELTLTRLGFVSASEAIGKSFWSQGERNAQFTIIGVVEDRNIQGLHNSIKPWMFYIGDALHFYGAVRIKEGASANVIADIEAIWKTVNYDFPIDHRFLDDNFESVYDLYKTMNSVLAGFASMAILLALIGLFGLAAFMARGRTKEVGIRKVMGASLSQIAKLLIWQFSKPVMWAIAFALPLSYFAANIYLDFFAERIDFQIPLIILAGFVTVSMAWSVIGLHAVNIARENPIKALRYE